MSINAFRELNDYLKNESFNGEIWAWYDDYRIEEKTIAVSNYARAFSFATGKFLKDYGQNQDYMYWYLNDWDEDAITVPIHRAVAECFCQKPNIPDRLVVDHIDGDKHNNLASNLRWLTYKENSNAQDVQKRKVESFKKTIEHRKEVETLTKLLVEKDKEIMYWKTEYQKLYKEKKQLEEFIKLPF